MPKITTKTLEAKLYEIARLALKIRFYLPNDNRAGLAAEWNSYLDDCCENLKEFQWAAFGHGVDEYDG